MTKKIVRFMHWNEAPLVPDPHATQAFVPAEALFPAQVVVGPAPGVVGPAAGDGCPAAGAVGPAAVVVRPA